MILKKKKVRLVSVLDIHSGREMIFRVSNLPEFSADKPIANSAILSVSGNVRKIFSSPGFNPEGIFVFKGTLMSDVLRHLLSLSVEILIPHE